MCKCDDCTGDACVALHPAACLYRPELRERFQRQIGLVLGE